MNIALIGVGYWGPNLLRNLVKQNEHQITVVDKNSERLSKIQELGYNKVSTQSDYKSLLSDPSIDCAIISTPVETHEHIAQDFLNAGKHVFVEKPLTNNLESSLKLEALAKKQKCVLFVGHVFLYHEVVRQIKDWIKKGDLGDIIYCTSIRTNLGPIRDDVNALWDLAPHDISIMSYLLDQKPISVNASAQSVLKKGHFDTVFANYEYENNILCQVNVSWITPKKVRKFRIVGSQKMIIWDDLNILEPIRIHNKGIGNEYHDLNYIQHLSAVGDGEVRLPKCPASEPLASELKEFINLVKHKKEDPFLPIAIQTVQALEATEKSILEEKKITFK